MIKVGIIGYGYMGEIRNRVLDSRDDVQVTIVCETDPKKLNKQYSFQTTRNPMDVIHSDVDAVIVCTPNNLIPDLTIEAIRRKKHVFAEKPPGRNLADIQNMREAELQNPGVKLMFGFNHRYHPGVQRAKKMIESGRLGKVLWVRGLYGKSGGKSFGQSWRNAKSVSGGGILLDQGIHMMDLFNYMCGDFEHVKAMTSHKYWNFEVEDNAYVIMQNSHGQNAILHSSATLWKHRFMLEIGMEDGYLIVEGLLSKTGSYGRETLKIGRRQFEDETDAVGNPSEEIIYFDKDLSWDLEIEKFVQAIKSNTPITESSSLDAYKVMLQIDKAYRDCGEIK